MLSYEWFKQKVKDSILDYLPESSNYQVDIITTTKNNNLVLDGLTIKDPNRNIFPTIYLNSFYNINYREGQSLEECLSEIARTYIEHSQIQDLDVRSLLRWDAVKDRIVCKLVCGENNEAYLQDKVYKNIGHLAIIYAIDMGEFQGNNGTIIFDNKLFESYAVSQDELHETALRNSEKLLPCVLTDIFSTMEVLMGQSSEAINYFSEENLKEQLPDNCDLFVLTNAQKLHGAAVLLYPNVLEAIGNKLGGDFFVLPSSIHEVLIYPKNGSALDLESLETMVAEVNATQVDCDEILSSRVLEYDTTEHILFCESKDNILIDNRASSEPKKTIDKMIKEANKTVAFSSRNNNGEIRMER